VISTLSQAITKDKPMTENKQIAQRFMDAVQRKQWDIVKSLLTENAVSWIPPSAEKVMGYPRYVQGAERIIEVRGRSSGERYSPKLDFKTTLALGDGEHVALFVTIRTLTTANVPYENDYVMLFRFENGRIAEWGEFLDTAHAYLQFGLKITT
jgi:ketosteroid isomerase-like protein